MSVGLIDELVEVDRNRIERWFSLKRKTNRICVYAELCSDDLSIIASMESIIMI